MPIERWGMHHHGNVRDRRNAEQFDVGETSGEQPKDLNQGNTEVKQRPGYIRYPGTGEIRPDPESAKEERQVTRVGDATSSGLEGKSRNSGAGCALDKVHKNREDKNAELRAQKPTSGEPAAKSGLKSATCCEGEWVDESKNKEANERKGTKSILASSLKGLGKPQYRKEFREEFEQMLNNDPDCWKRRFARESLANKED